MTLADFNWTHFQETFFDYISLGQPAYMYPGWPSFCDRGVPVMHNKNQLRNYMTTGPAQANPDTDTHPGNIWASRGQPRYWNQGQPGLTLILKLKPRPGPGQPWYWNPEQPGTTLILRLILATCGPAWANPYLCNHPPRLCNTKTEKIKNTVFYYL